MPLFGNSRRSGHSDGARTAAEREEARRERERRRAPNSEERSSIDPPVDPPDSDSQSAQPQNPTFEHSQPPAELNPDEPALNDQASVEPKDLQSAEPPAVLTDEHDLEDQQTAESPAVLDEHQPEPHVPAADSSPRHHEPLGEPVLSAAVGRPLARPRAARDALLEHRASRLRAHRVNRIPHRRMTRARVAALIALALALALVWFLASLIQPFHGSGHGKVIVEIPKGSSSSRIGSILARDGVVSSGFFFEVRALLDGKRSDLHSGRFQLRLDMSYSAAIDALSKPPPQAIPVKIVIPEGLTRAQIAILARENALKGSYLAAATRSALLDPAHYGAPHGTPNLEGFLFPATYELNAGVPASQLVSEQLHAFAERFGPQEIARARTLHETPYDLLIVASMVEREAQVPGDRAKIAAVIYNRLKQGMPLGIDATIYYAVEQQKQIATYTGELTETQLHINSPYNTRTHTGLPPTPISNPGMASIEAAAHPAHVPYLYYVAGADGCGEQVFSRTAAQFESNVAAYRAALAHNGGKPPICKRK